MKELRLWKTSQYYENFKQTKRSLMQLSDIPGTIMDTFNLTFNDDHLTKFISLSGD